MRAEQLTDAVAYHGEGPVWSERWGGLRWLDMLAGDVLSFAEDGTTVERRHVSRVVAALRPRCGGGAVYGIDRGFALEQPDGTIDRLGDLWPDEGFRMNEGAADPDGRFYCGSMAYDTRASAAALYRLDPGGSGGCTFGGPRLDELFITTSREGLAPGDEPRAGSLFRAAPGVRGVPVREFGE